MPRLAPEMRYTDVDISEAHAKFDQYIYDPLLEGDVSSQDWMTTAKL